MQYGINSVLTAVVNSRSDSIDRIFSKKVGAIHEAVSAKAEASPTRSSGFPTV